MKNSRFVANRFVIVKERKRNKLMVECENLALHVLISLWLRFGWHGVNTAKSTSSSAADPEFIPGFSSVPWEITVEHGFERFTTVSC